MKPYKAGFPLMLAVMALCLLAACACPAKTGTDGDPHPNRSHLLDDGFATPENPVISPSGSYKMVIEPSTADEVYFNHFVIYSAQEDGQTVFTGDSRYRTRDRLLFLWDEGDNIWVYSGDTGIAYWQKDGDAWERKDTPPTEAPGALEAALSAS